MTRTITINLNGVAFSIDEDAYNLLQSYLRHVEANLSNLSDKAEVMRDIEARIAELLADMLRVQHKQVVSNDMIDAVIGQLGRPDDFKDDNEDDKPSQQFFKKKLYRDANDRILAGVCSGLAHFIGINPIWIRLIFVLACLCYGIPVALYLVLWLIMPEARTAAQRLDMRGESPTVENIEREIGGGGADSNSPVQRGCLAEGLLVCVRLCLWGIVGLMVLVAVATIITIFFGLIAAMTGAAAASPLGIIGVFYTHNHTLTVVLSILLSIVIALPIVALLVILVRYARKGKAISPAAIWTMLVLWIVALLGCVGIGAWQVLDNPEVIDFFEEPQSQRMVESKESNISLDPFHSVQISGAATIRFIEDNEFFAAVRSKDIAGVKLEVVDSVLQVSTGKAGATIELHADELKSLSMSGAGKFRNTGIYEGNRLEVKTSGASEIDLNVDLRELSIITSGASDLELEGRADRLLLDVSGAGEVDADKLMARVVSVQTSGAADIEVYASDSLITNAGAMSVIKYKGDAVVDNQSKGGKIIKRGN